MVLVVVWARGNGAEADGSVLARCDAEIGFDVCVAESGKAQRGVLIKEVVAVPRAVSANQFVFVDKSWAVGWRRAFRVVVIVPRGVVESWAWLNGGGNVLWSVL